VPPQRRTAGHELAEEVARTPLAPSSYVRREIAQPPPEPQRPVPARRVETIERLGEPQFYTRRRGEAETDLAALEAAAPGVLLGPGPIADKVALLRALDGAGSRATVDLLSRVLREVPAVSDARGDSLPSYALRRLTERAGGDRAARAALRAAAFGPGEARDASLRMRAAGALARTATPEELRSITAELDRDLDPLLVQAFRAGLAANPEAAREQRLLKASGAPVDTEP
jgi:hypothetical protein